MLDQDVAALRSLTFAESTRRTYQSQQALYLQFCSSLHIATVPISPCNLGNDIAFLGSKISFSSVRQYLNVVRIMHLDEGYSNPQENNFYLSSILKGPRKHKGDGISQKLPITMSILQGILVVLNLNNPFDVCFWAACLVAFFSFFRKSNLLIPSHAQFNPAKHLCVSDAQFGPHGAALSIRWSKTIQYKQRTLLIPLPHIAGSLFCPSSALMLCTSLIPKQDKPLPLFSFPTPQGTQPITYATFITHLRLCLRKLGFNPSLYSGHSFWRGGSSFALQCGIPANWIKLQGGWSNQAYQQYLDHSFEHSPACQDYGELLSTLWQQGLSTLSWLTLCFGSSCFACMGDRSHTCVIDVVLVYIYMCTMTFVFNMLACVPMLLINSTSYLGLGLWRSIAFKANEIYCIIFCNLICMRL